MLRDGREKNEIWATASASPRPSILCGGGRGPPPAAAAGVKIVLEGCGVGDKREVWVGDYIKKIIMS